MLEADKALGNVRMKRHFTRSGDPSGSLCGPSGVFQLERNNIVVALASVFLRPDSVVLTYIYNQVGGYIYASTSYVKPVVSIRSIKTG